MAAGFDLRADRLKKTVMLAIKMRAGVERDRVKREVEAVYDPEGPARLALSLERLFAGLLVIGVKRDRAMQIIDSVAMDSTPHLRLKAYRALNDEWQTTRVIATAVQLPRSTVRRSLEDLVAQGLALRMEKRVGPTSGNLPAKPVPQATLVGERTLMRITTENLTGLSRKLQYRVSMQGYLPVIKSKNPMKKILRDSFLLKRRVPLMAPAHWTKPPSEPWPVDTSASPMTTMGAFVTAAR